MSEQILIESMSANDGNILTETSVDNRNVFLHGIFMQAEQKNRNGRIYPLSEMVAAVASMNEHIRQYGGLFGELDHPENRLSIAMDRVSHVITELQLNGSNVIGKAKLLDTPMGLIAKEIGRSGARYGVSSRGAGQVDESGRVSGFRLVTIDIVATPSALGAMPSTVYESLQNYKSGRVITLAEAVRNDISARKYFKDEIRKFITLIYR